VAKFKNITGAPFLDGMTLPQRFMDKGAVLEVPDDLVPNYFASSACWEPFDKPTKDMCAAIVKAHEEALLGETDTPMEG
jgi:hypothetical protein